MNYRKGLTSVIFASLIASAATAEPEKNETRHGFQQLIGLEMLKAYENKTMEGVYNSYAEDMMNDIQPITFTETHHDNATSTYNHRGEIKFTTTGIYTVKKDQMCYYYNDPDHIIGQFCFFVFKSDNCYYHFASDEPLPVTRDDFENWTSMAYRHEDADNCLPDLS